MRSWNCWNCRISFRPSQLTSCHTCAQSFCFTVATAAAAAAGDGGDGDSSWWTDTDGVRLRLQTWCIVNYSFGWQPLLWSSILTASRQLTCDSLSLSAPSYGLAQHAACSNYDIYSVLRQCADRQHTCKRSCDVANVVSYRTARYVAT